MLLTSISLCFFVFLSLISEKILNAQHNKISGAFKFFPAACKLTASGLFVFFLFYFSPSLNVFGYLLLIGLLFSFLGDALLLPKSKNSWFLFGIVAFALAHLSFSAAFLQLPHNFTTFMLSGFFCLLCGTLTYLWLKPYLSGQYKIMLPVYLILIVVMLTLGLSGGYSSHNFWLLIGSLLFAISDLFVARHRFVKAAFINRVLGLPLYYLAQMMIAYGAIIQINSN